MKPVLNKGELITWKDDRGFGFIKPNGGGKKVCLHISQLKDLTNPHPQAPSCLGQHSLELRAKYFMSFLDST
ncbi:cold shock domain-containing protein [Pleurocapsa sp. FMAR1]|uniref:cold shock domain-containing protein n=1 Tax=Pleurocapsa sp. FMAR1 TaxID=3040204 RepID=UPI0029C7277A|nr:cold shock domain-containing protein [Pleurocapsa sp. FMAR1]